MINGYLAVGNKCAVCFQDLQLPVTTEEALALLWKKGFRVVEVDLVNLARKCVGKSRYRRGAKFFEAPFTVDCSTLTKWVYAKAGIWLPRHSIDQREMGKVVPITQIEAGDLIFTAGVVSYWYNSAADGVGHVGLVTGERTVIHAANKKRNIVEDDLESFVGKGNDFRGIRRIKTASTIILESPSNRVVEWSGEIRNIIMQNLAN